MGLRIWADCHGSRSWYNRHGAYRDGIYDSRTISVEREEHPRKLKTLSDPTLTSGFFHLSFPRRPEHRRCIPTDRCGSHFYRSPTTRSACSVYGKWPFYRLGPIQEPFSLLMSLGNLYVNLRGITEIRRRVRSENKLRRWLEVLGWVEVNTWVWSAVFHSRGT